MMRTIITIFINLHDNEKHVQYSMYIQIKQNKSLKIYLMLGFCILDKQRQLETEIFFKHFHRVL